MSALDFMRTQLLLPIPGKEGLAGIMSLGPKLSEAPYSRVDIRLTQSIAAQMGLAVENSRLAASLAAEAAARERHLARISEAFAAVARNLSRYSLKTEEAIGRRLESARAQYDEGELFCYELARGRQGRFALTWKIGGQALDRRKPLGGA